MDLLKIILQNRKDIEKLKKQLICCLQNSTTDSPFVIPISSSDFSIDGHTYTNPTLDGKTYELFFNDLNRFLYNEPGNQEWNYVGGGGFEILLPGFDANSNDYRIYLLIKA